MKVLRQSDSTDASLRAHGCGAYSACNVLVWASGGTWKPQGKAGTISARIRVDRSGVTDADFNERGLTRDELHRSMLDIGASDLRMDVPVQRRSGVNVLTDLLPQLAADGLAAMVAVRYGAVQDAGKGVGSFRGGHWVTILEPSIPKGTVDVMDPLRRQVVTWPIDVLVRAMETFGDKPWLRGRGEAIVVWPWQTWRSGYGAVKAARDTARKERDAALARVAAYEATPLDEAIRERDELRAKVAKAVEVLG